MKLKDFLFLFKNSNLDVEIGKGSLVNGKWEFDGDILIRFCDSKDFVNFSDKESLKEIIVIF